MDNFRGLSGQSAYLTTDYWTLTHRALTCLQLLEVKRVVTAPGRSESESLILAFGLDLFCTRISPSQSFDLLSPSFNRLQLYVTISILAGTLFVVRRVVSRLLPLKVEESVLSNVSFYRSLVGKLAKNGTLKALDRYLLLL